jgi:hypothetical protein
MLLLSIHLRLGLPSGLFPSSFPIPIRGPLFPNSLYMPRQPQILNVIISFNVKFKGLYHWEYGKETFVPENANGRDDFLD